MKKNNICLFCVAFAAAISFSSCSDDFLEEKKNYDNVTVEAYNNFAGASARVSDVYAWSLPDANANCSWKYNCTGLADDQSKSTEEYSGFSVFVNPENELTYKSGDNPVPDYFHNQGNNIQQSVWGRIRNINDCIAGIEGSTLSADEKNQLLGQVYFFRAWCYYNLVKWYGGVPIITEVQNPVASSVTPRSTTKECIDFICSDLDKSAELLAPFTTDGGWKKPEDYGRVTSGTALALKGRVLLLWASPIFNRSNDVSRYQKAYDTMKADLETINSCGYGLANETNPGVNASGWASIFSTRDNNPEAVFVSLYNNIVSGGTPDYSRNNGWENGIRPSNAQGGGGKSPSAMIVDLFPMKDGKKPANLATYTLLNGSSNYSYDSEYPFMDRDPRFYRTFAFPGVRWAFSGDPTSSENHNPYVGQDYELWNYVWYNNEADRDNVESGNTYGADNLLGNAKGMYVRKRTDDFDVNSSPLYNFNQSFGFKYSAAPYLEIRYAEVLLNLAEAACGAGDKDYAVSLLKRIRARVGYTSEGNYGLQDDLTSNQAACMSAILYERQIELAYEGKRFDDLRRWMLFDGGTGKVEGAPSSWTLTGWGGNTCNYLGFTPLNGQRRDNMEFRVSNDINKGLGETAWKTSGDEVISPDPLANVARPAAVDFRKSADEFGKQLSALKEFYQANLVRKKKKGDAFYSNHAELYINFRPKYYFLGFYQSAMSSNQTLPQTIGWGDYNNGGANGTFDPLAE